LLPVGGGEEVAEAFGLDEVPPLAARYNIAPTQPVAVVRAEPPEGLATGYFVKPTVFGRVDPDMTIAREEIFGPVLSVIPFKSVEDGIAEGNATTYGLAAAVWTRDVAKALKAARAIRAGTVWINAYNLFDAALPFGGFKESGFGREMGSAGLDLYTEVKSVWVDLS